MTPDITELVKSLSPAAQTIVLLVWFAWQTMAAKKVQGASTEKGVLEAELLKQRTAEHVELIRELQEARNDIVVELRCLREDLNHGLQTQARQGAHIERIPAIETKIDRGASAG